MPYFVTTYYKFTSLPKRQLPTLKRLLEEKAQELGILGLVLIAEEGINATISGGKPDLLMYKDFLVEHFGGLRFKDSVSDIRPFKRFKVKIRPEIVQLKREDIQPVGTESHLSPDEWDALMAEDDTVLIDVRNWYETKLGSFTGAVDPKTWQFSQFPEWLKKSGIAADAKIGIFCTGGIRCEKAAVIMHEEGYRNVHQLDGGILNYIENRPQGYFEGDCFVFDHRVAVGQGLQPTTRYGKCPHCGNGGEVSMACVQCEASFKTCQDCLSALPAALCSKNCRYRYAQLCEKEGV